ncbi:MutS-related protein [Prolixibacter denitrificans]|uniref:DNA mismatch repair protein MutS n=1 Tax=Prolixibacter denitrificans TaxID=1541063 RepID=A0A2P8CDP3_9BACT|nr:DNA mismatch repair protein MutS [Prolixibacter denitrificans]PSK83091.1 MutS-like protein [Prolixibacter denitrificans]GET22025.1 DNA mismatch repair protein MutS [Prolixibacter denitrificans]
MVFNRKKEEENLQQSFGKLKDATFDFDSIGKYFRKKQHPDAFQIISDKTCDDLDFEELFMFLDRTQSKVGQQYLYNKLRVIPENHQEVASHEALLTRLINEPAYRVAIQKQLKKLDKRESYYIPALFQDEHLQPPKWFFLIRILSFSSLLSLVLIPFLPQMLFFWSFIILINFALHYRNKRNLYAYLAPIPQLLIMNSVARELFKDHSLKKLNPNLASSIKDINKVRNRMSLFKLEANLGGDAVAIFWAFVDIIKIVFLLEPLLLFGVLKQLDTKRKQIEEVYSFIGLTDTLISVASLRHGLTHYCQPEVHGSDKKISAREVYHPLIPECVTNNIEINGKSILLTGSNMSGKTSFIRTIGINAITAQTINTCFARQFSLPKMRVFSAIRISDDLMNDRSYYFQEVLTIKEMIDKSHSETPNIYLLDEIFKGTNTIERISAGKAILSSLNQNNHIVFVSTHDIELADLLKDEYELFHFSEIVNHQSIDFDFKLKDGKLKNRNAIRILQINEYPDEIIKEAIKISADLDKASLHVKPNLSISGQ